MTPASHWILHLMGMNVQISYLNSFVGMIEDDRLQSSNTDGTRIGLERTTDQRIAQREVRRSDC